MTEDILAAIMIAVGSSLLELVTVITTERRGYLEVMGGHVAVAAALTIWPCVKPRIIVNGCDDAPWILLSRTIMWEICGSAFVGRMDTCTKSAGNR